MHSHLHCGTIGVNYLYVPALFTDTHTNLTGCIRKQSGADAAQAIAKQESAKLFGHAVWGTLLTASALSAFDATGNLPPGIYQVSMQEIVSRFCQGEVREHWGHVL